jgi:hypothetical protein
VHAATLHLTRRVTEHAAARHISATQRDDAAQRSDALLIAASSLRITRHHHPIDLSIPPRAPW